MLLKNTVANATASKSGRTVMKVNNPLKWTAETPNLYTLTASMKGSDEVIPVNVGFRKIEPDRQADSREWQVWYCSRVPTAMSLDPGGGYVVSPERMLQDIEPDEEAEYQCCPHLPLSG